MASYKWKTPRSTSRGTRPPDTRPAGQRGPRRLEAEERKQRLRDAVSHRESGEQATQGGHPQVSSCRSISGLQQDPSLCRDPANSHVSHRLLQVGSVPGQQRRGDVREPHPAAVSADNGRSACGWARGNPQVRREVAREEKILQKFVRQHPCPSEKALRRWLRHMSEAPMQNSEQQPTFTWVMKDMGWRSEHLAWFHYPSFRELWESAALPAAEAFSKQRRAGSNLYERGGKECMQFNFYALQHAMCGEDFHTDAPLPVYSYAKHLEHVWDGIGSWRA